MFDARLKDTGVGIVQTNDGRSPHPVFGNNIVGRIDQVARLLIIDAVRQQAEQHQHDGPAQCVAQQQRVQTAMSRIDELDIVIRHKAER